jgi:hypothetical protein
MQLAAAFNRQSVLGAVNSGVPQVFMVGYKSATKPAQIVQIS